MRTLLLLCLAALGAIALIPMTGCTEGAGGVMTDAIVFNSEAPFATQSRVDTPWVWLMTASGTDIVPVFDFEANATSHGELSPDGTRIVYVELTGGGLILYDLATGDVNQLYEGNQPLNPSWSPDGSTIVFSDAVGDGDAAIYAIDVDTEIVTPLLVEEGEEFYNPKYNRAGTRIVFQSDSDGAIYVMDADGTDVSLPLTDGGFNLHPSFLPDGRILFVHEEGAILQTRQGGADIWIMNGDGSGPRNLTDTLGDDEFYPTSNYAGTAVAFGVGNSSDGDIYVAHFNGANLVSPVNVTADNPNPCWHPAFGRIRTNLLETVFSPPL
ncbi:MAG: hypothetical protein ACYC7E_18865 [Armatimonadota bacterium]